MKAKLRAPIPFSAANKMVSRRLHATQRGGGGLLNRLGDDVARRHLSEDSVPPANGRLRHAADGNLETPEPRLPLDRRINAETTELSLRRRLSRPELHPPVGYQIEHGDPFSRPGRVVVRRRGLHDAMPDTHALGPLAGSS